MKVSRAGSLPQGGVQDPLHLKGWLLASVAVFPSLSKNSFRRKRLAKSSMSACISDQLMRCGVGTKVNPRESSLISASDSSTLERFITVSSGCWLEVLCLFERDLRFFLFFWLRGGLAFRGEGETKRQLHERFGEHRRSIQNHHQLTKPTPVSAHFNQPGHSINHLLLTPLELIHSKRDSVRKAREAHLINKASRSVSIDTWA